MGLFAEWVMVRIDRLPRGAVEARFADEGLNGDTESGGWLFAQTKGHEPNGLVRRLSRGDEAVIAGWVYDSDFAYVAGAGRDRSSFSLVIGEPYTDSDEDDSSRELAHLAGDAGRRESASALAAWSEQNTPKTISVEQVLEILGGEWTFAEEGLAELFDGLGLSGLDQAALAHRDARPESGVVISLAIHKLATVAALGLARRLDRFGPLGGTAHTPQTIEIELSEAPITGSVLDELLAEVQQWVDELGLDFVTVFAGGRAHTVERQGPLRPT
jgi:hypothetical protein